MSDLISRSELIMRLSDYALQESPNDNESKDEQRISKMIYDAIQNCISCVEEQPTAYSVDEVVGELKKRSKEYNSGVRLHGKPEEMITDEAIEIVKQGGVSDDVCEWKHSGNVFISCNYKRFTDLHSFEHCPYCSKKIKVVE